jgi:hypothetical protein
MEDNIKNQRIAEEMEKARRKAIEGTVEATLEDIAALEKKNSLLQEGVTSELDYLDQAAETKAAFEAGTVSLDKNTEAGRNNIRMLIDTSDAAIKQADSQLQSGTAADTVAASYDAQREAMLRQIDAITGNRTESEKLMATWGLFTKEISTEIKTNGAAQAKTDIETIPATKDTQVNVDDNGTTGAVQGRVDSIHGNSNVFVDVDDNGTVPAVQGRIDGIHGRDEVKVDVDDVYTVSETQRRIDGIHGKDVDINVRITNLSSIQNDLALLTVPRTAYVDIVQRRGQEAP